MCSKNYESKKFVSRFQSFAWGKLIINQKGVWLALWNKQSRLLNYGACRYVSTFSHHQMVKGCSYDFTFWLCRLLLFLLSGYICAKNNYKAWMLCAWSSKLEVQREVDCKRVDIMIGELNVFYSCLRTVSITLLLVLLSHRAKHHISNPLNWFMSSGSRKNRID